jgi:hypothetical protein
MLLALVFNHNRLNKPEWTNMNNLNVSNSYIQDQRHTKVSDKFNVIQASQVGQVMVDNGLLPVSISSGKGRLESTKDFQRTLSRYRGPEVADGVFLDIVYDSKHMGRGVDRLHVGIFRMVCTNGLFTGTSFFKHGIRHNGDTYANLNTGILAALGMQAKLSETIGLMQRTILTPSQREFLALEAVKLLTPDNSIEVKHRLLTPNRESDKNLDLWSTYNLTQENSVKGNNIAYTLQSIDSVGRPNVRRMAGRAIKPNSDKDASFNQSLFDVALKLIA